MSKSGIAVVLAIVGALAAAGVIVWAFMKDAPAGESSSESTHQISVEIRAMPVASIKIDGKAVGKTPLSLRYPKSNREIEIEATMTPHIYDGRGRAVAEPSVEKRKVKLDQDQVIDFVLTKPKVVPKDEIVVEPEQLKK